MKCDLLLPLLSLKFEFSSIRIKAADKIIVAHVQPRTLQERFSTQLSLLEVSFSPPLASISPSVTPSDSSAILFTPHTAKTRTDTTATRKTGMCFSILKFAAYPVRTRFKPQSNDWISNLQNMQTFTEPIFIERGYHLRYWSPARFP